MTLPARVPLTIALGAVSAAAALPTLILLPMALRRPPAPQKSPLHARAGSAGAESRGRSGAAARTNASRVVETRNVFQPQVSGSRPKQGLVPAASPTLPEGLFGPGPLVAVKGAEATPEQSLGDWVWTGTVSMGNRDYAVLQHRKTRVGAFVKAGDSFEGGQVASVSNSALLFRRGDKLLSIAMSSGVEASGSAGGGGGAQAPPAATAAAPPQPAPAPGGPQPPGAAPPAPAPAPAPNAPVAKVTPTSSSLVLESTSLGNAELGVKVVK